MRIDSNEYAFAASQQLIFLIEDFGLVNMSSSPNLDFPSLNPQWLIQWNRLDVLDRHLFRKGDDMPQLIHLSHGIIENGRDNSAVAVAGWARIALAQPKSARRYAVFFIQGKFQVHPVAIMHSAGKTIILLQARGRRVVTMARGFLRHGENCILRRAMKAGCALGPGVRSPKSFDFVRLAPRFARDDRVGKISAVKWKQTALDWR